MQALFGLIDGRTRMMATVFFSTSDEQLSCKVSVTGLFGEPSSSCSAFKYSSTNDDENTVSPFLKKI